MAKLENYLETYRRRAGLSQREVAFLLGAQSGSKVCRYERLWERPTLETLLAYEAILGVPARELFAGVFEKVEKTIFERASALAKQLEAAKSDRVKARKVALLKSLAAAKERGPHNP
jgi:transcriptional regulator with XRE-family HTH domain